MKGINQKKNHKYFFKFRLFFFFLFQLIYHSNEYNISDACKINDDIVRNQCLNNIITIEIENLRYISFGTYPNGDMVFQTGTFPNSQIRAFLGFKENGRGFFKNITNEYYFHSFSISNNSTQKFESQDIVIKLTNNETITKEYLLSVSLFQSDVEIYDLENYIIYSKLLSNFTQMNDIRSIRDLILPLYSNNSDSYYLFGILGEKNDTFNNNYILQIHKFNSIENFLNKGTLELEKIEFQSIQINDTGFSCFLTENKVIICFFLTIDKIYIINAYDLNLNLKTSFNLTNTEQIFFNQIFYKCIHYKEEIGIFSYYKNYSNIYYPILIFKKYEENQFIDFLNSTIIINKLNIKYDPYLLLTDIIKLSNNKLCLCLTYNIDNDYLYLVLINLFQELKYKIRYYIINLKILYGLRLHMDMRSHYYHNFLVTAFSYYDDNNDKCKSSSCAALIIFGYPNSTDNELYLDDFLKENLTLNYININLTNNIIIENNVFGYVFSSIKIKNLENCNNLVFYSENKNLTITQNYNLSQNETIKLKFSEINYDPFICNIQYYYIITEPDLEKYDLYPNITDGENETSNFEKEEYIGRLTYYYIILNETLFTKECNNTNCDFCFIIDPSVCVKCKYGFTYIDDLNINCSDKEIIVESTYIETIIKVGNIEVIKREIKESKEELIEILPNLIDSIDIGKNYEYEGEDYIIIIKPTNTSIPSATNIDFSSCEKILREYYKISESRIITFFQLELNDKNSQSLVNQVGYQVFDDQKNPLNLSLCNDTNIQIFYLMKQNTSINLGLISSFKDSDIDIFNIEDDFFNDICTSYSDESSNDIVLEDRIKDIYQNYSLCDDGCSYNSSDLDLMIIACDCKVKDNITSNITETIYTQLTDIKKPSVFAIIKCYQLVFSLKNKLNNYGFIIFSILLLAHIPLFILYFYKGIKPIREYLAKEMSKNGYIKKNEITAFIEGNNIDIKKLDKKIKKNKNRTKYKKKRSKINPPPKKNLKIRTNNIIKIQKENENSTTAFPIYNKNNKIPLQINNIINESNIQIENDNKRTKNKKQIFKRITIKNNDKNQHKTKNIPNLQTQGIQGNEMAIENNIEEQKAQKINNDIIILNLININLKRRNSYAKKDSTHILNIYTSFKEACKMDLRSVLMIFYIYLISRQPFFNVFFYRSPLVLLPLRLCLLFFIFGCDLALNALFYFDDKISKKYRLAQSLFIFAFSNNITVILLSTFIGFILFALFTKLSNSVNSIREVFRKEEEKLRGDKKYKINNIRKREIQNEINNILNKYKIKIIILIVIEVLIMVFFWYYITAFCQVYSNTQTSWLWDSLLSMLSRLVIDLLLCLIFAKLYRIAIESNINCIYKVSLFFYNFEVN